MKNLKQILRDDVKISEIVRSFPIPEDIYEIINILNKFQNDY